MQAEPIGPTVDMIRDALSWLGKCKREQAGHSMHLAFRFTPEGDARSTLRLKVEINTREHDSLFGIRFEWRNVQADPLLHQGLLSDASGVERESRF